jgi:GNAT superfamily N-acetyltransferase
MTERNAVKMVAPARATMVTAPLSWRQPTPADVTTLGALMLDAYRGTIDYDGESLDDAIAEVASYFDGESTPLLDCSVVAFDGEDAVSACLVTLAKDEPMVSYVYTAAAWKERGLASALLQLSLNAVAKSGYPTLSLWVTVGNTPAEHIYTKLGFVAETTATS